jgi:formate hydrogenlyase subunit 4
MTVPESVFVLVVAFLTLPPIITVNILLGNIYLAFYNWSADLYYLEILFGMVGFNITAAGFVASGPFTTLALMRLVALMVLAELVLESETGPLKISEGIPVLTFTQEPRA